MEDPRVAVVGSGPAGIYAAAALTAHEDAAVDVIDRAARGDRVIVSGA